MPATTVCSRGHSVLWGNVLRENMIGCIFGTYSMLPFSLECISIFGKYVTELDLRVFSFANSNTQNHTVDCSQTALVFES